ncbi:MAG: ribosome maturation factor RimP [Bacteroidetes bacterium]|nr:ribosome maturation factor RimP [Bacteroidota bacterium]MDA0874303.1 ribosome maturation factor RimP [Bacteroidota bacterium]
MSELTTHIADDRPEILSLQARVRQLVDELVQREDWFVVDVTVRGRKGSRVVEVFIDGDQGVSVDDMAVLSREMSSVLDAEDTIKGKYHLNVSSPGDERALLMERQYRRHVGKVLLVLVNGEEGEVWVEGENLGPQDGVLMIRTKTGTKEIAMDAVSKARIKLPW